MVWCSRCCVANSRRLVHEFYRQKLVAGTSKARRGVMGQERAFVSHALNVALGKEVPRRLGGSDHTIPPSAGLPSVGDIKKSRAA